MNEHDYKFERSSRDLRNFDPSTRRTLVEQRRVDTALRGLPSGKYGAEARKAANLGPMKRQHEDVSKPRNIIYIYIYIYLGKL